MLWRTVVAAMAMLRMCNSFVICPYCDPNHVHIPNLEEACREKRKSSELIKETVSPVEDVQRLGYGPHLVRSHVTTLQYMMNAKLS